MSKSVGAGSHDSESARGKTGERRMCGWEGLTRVGSNRTQQGLGMRRATDLS